MRNTILARLIRTVVALMPMLVAAPAMAAVTRYASDAALRAALGPSFVLTTENFDGFDSGTVFHNQTPGLFASSPNQGNQGFLPLQVLLDSGAASPPNVLFGGAVPGQPTPPQVMVLDFDPAITVFAFNLVDQDPNATGVTVRFDYGNESTESFTLANETESETTPIFFGARSTLPIVRVTVTSGLENGGEGGFEEFGIDDLEFGGGDTNPPLCSASPQATEGGLRIFGTATDNRSGDSGLVSIALEEGADNVTLLLDPEFEPGAGSTSFTAFPTEYGGIARGRVVVTDGAGFTCEVGIDFRAVPAGPTENLTLCQEPGILFAVSNSNPTPEGTGACSATLPGGSEPPFPPGYEPSPADDPTPCTVLTIESPIAGTTTMIYKKDGTFDARLRLLFSRSTDGGATFPPFNDVTDSVEPILTVDPDPTRIKGTVNWSPVKVTCAIQTTADCSSISPSLDSDADGYPLCPAAGSSQAADCNDQRSFIHPGATEQCNGLDDNCDGRTDEDNPGSDAACTVRDLKGACAAGRTSCVDGALACQQTVQPTTEVCNGIDDDCDGQTDENYVFGAFQPPLRADTAIIVKRGRTVPVKFTLFGCSGRPVTTAVARLQIYQYANQVIGTLVDDVGASGQANTDDLFRFDGASGQYIYNLSTSGLAAGKSYLLRAVLDDGSTDDVLIAVR